MEAAQINLIIQVVLAIVGTLISVIFNRIQKDIGKITESLEQLNVKLAVVCTKTENHERRLNVLKKEF